MKNTRRFDFNFRPLQVSCSISVDGSVPDRQSYEAYSKTHTPDYTLTPLALVANVSIIDKDGVLPAGSVNKGLANIKWYETEKGVEKLISTTNTDYRFGADGSADAGRIQVKKNVEPEWPLTLRFEADYVDPRTGQVHKIVLSKLLTSRSETVNPQLRLDCAGASIYNPLDDADKQTVKATLSAGGGEVAAANRVFLWEKLREDGTWSEIGSDIMDYDVQLSADKASVTVDRSLMGEELHIRCRAKYDAGGNPAAVTLNDGSPCAVAVWRRRMPSVETEIINVPYNIPKIPYIFPGVSVRDNKKILSDAVVNGHFRVDWYTAKNSTGTLNYTKVAEGLNPQIPTSMVTESMGGILAVEVEDAGRFRPGRTRTGA